MPAILIVCTANICRSPVAEALLQNKLDALEPGWRVSSAGTLGVEGWPPAAASAAMTAIRGIDITGHLSTAISVELLIESDLVLCMEKAHVDYLVQLHPPAEPKILRLAEMSGQERDIPDPYGGPIQEFEAMVEDVDAVLDQGLDRIVSLASANIKLGND